jgi:hypothetical protein
MFNLANPDWERLKYWVQTISNVDRLSPIIVVGTHLGLSCLILGYFSPSSTPNSFLSDRLPLLTNLYLRFSWFTNRLDKMKSEGDGKKGKKTTLSFGKEVEAQLQSVPGAQRIKQWYFISNKVTFPNRQFF